MHCQGALGEYIVVSKSQVSPKPSTLSWQQSAGLVLDALRAWQGLTAGGSMQLHDLRGKRYVHPFNTFLILANVLKEWNMFQIFSCHLISICF